MADTTRIMDLPENVTMQMNPVIRGDGINTNYSPMDIHPNPYGHPPPSVPSMPMPSSNSHHMQKNIQVPNQNQNSIPTHHQSLPSRDIPQYTSSIVQDPQIQANYIPPITPSIHQTAEYMRQYDELNDKKINAHQVEKKNQSNLNSIVDQYQLPILVSLLFFIFHMPIVDQYIFNYLYFLNIHKPDGNINLNGLILRSAAFGILLHTLTYIMNTIVQY